MVLIPCESRWLIKWMTERWWETRWKIVYIPYFLTANYQEAQPALVSSSLDCTMVNISCRSDGCNIRVIERGEETFLKQSGNLNAGLLDIQLVFIFQSGILGPQRHPHFPLGQIPGGWERVPIVHRLRISPVLLEYLQQKNVLCCCVYHSQCRDHLGLIICLIMSGLVLGWLRSVLFCIWFLPEL